MEAIATGLDGLVAKTAEVQAMSVSGGLDLSEDRLAELNSDLDGLRSGLAEADEVSRRVLGDRIDTAVAPAASGKFALLKPLAR